MNKNKNILGSEGIENLKYFIIWLLTEHHLCTFLVFILEEMNEWWENK